MSLVPLIEPTIPVLRATDTVEEALFLMADNHVDRLPLVDLGKYITLIKEAHLLDFEDGNAALSSLIFEPTRPGCLHNVHPFDAVKTAIQFKLPMVPVLSERDDYLGCVSRDTLFNYLGQFGGLAEPGGIVVLEVKPQDYMLSQIARIAENENVKILNARVYFNTQSDMLEVTLKLNNVNIQRLVSAYERYEYVVKEMYGDIPAQDDLDERYKLLMNYLNI